jgi:hypothetical protein
MVTRKSLQAFKWPKYTPAEAILKFQKANKLKCLLQNLAFVSDSASKILEVHQSETFE